MRVARALLAALLSAGLVESDAVAIVLKPSPKDIERALKLAQAPEQQRASFHAPYIVRLDDPVVETIEVITEYRRYVLVTEEQLRMGNWLFAQSPDRAQENVKPWRERLTLSARLRFHPQNTLIGIPPYDIAIGDPDLAPLEVTRTPINAMMSGRRGDHNAPLLGTILDAVFNASSVGQQARHVIVSLRGETVASTTIDFSRLD
jgi:hypothetical protein